MPVLNNNISFKCCLLGVIFLFGEVVDLRSQTVVFSELSALCSKWWELI